MFNSFRFTIVFISWMVFITLLSLFSFSNMDTPAISIPNMDKLVHFTFYGVAAFLGCLFLRERTNGQLQLSRAIGVVFAFCVIYGIIIEVIQKELTVDREGDIMDALANSLGAFGGVSIIKILFSGKTPLKWKI